MALKGTIRDFGIADIFQLIGQQTKSGILVLKDEVDEVRIHFREGAVVRAESPTRARQMLLGNMLLNAGVITKAELDRALQQQTRAMRRIGRILVDDVGALDSDDLGEFLRLQLSETVQRLFLWQSGTYEFEQLDVPAPEDGLESVRAENILMDGLRVLDEWPTLRQRLPPYSSTFEVVRELPEPVSDDAALGDFEFGGEGGDSGGEATIGEPERVLHRSVSPGVRLDKLIHRSRLGEFEACRAIMTLLDGGYIRLAVSAAATRDLAVPEEKERKPPLRIPFGRIALRALVYVVIFLGAGLVARGLFRHQLDVGYALEPTTPRGAATRNQIERLELALEVYRLAAGDYPESLEQLVTAGILETEELRFPFELPYRYLREGEKARIVPPLY